MAENTLVVLKSIVYQATAPFATFLYAVRLFPISIERIVERPLSHFCECSPLPRIVRSREKP